jgi:hypothetical protein
MPPPPDVAGALSDVDLQETFAGLAVGKQNHIILWIEEAAFANVKNVTGSSIFQRFNLDGKTRTLGLFTRAA